MMAGAQEDNVIALGGIAFCEDTSFADNFSACFFGQLRQGFHGSAGTDDIVEQQYILALEAVNIRTIKAEILYTLGGDGDILDPDGVFHISLDGLAGNDVAGHTQLTGKISRGECLLSQPSG